MVFLARTLKKCCSVACRIIPYPTFLPWLRKIIIFVIHDLWKESSTTRQTVYLCKVTAAHLAGNSKAMLIPLSRGGVSKFTMWWIPVSIHPLFISAKKNIFSLSTNFNRINRKGNQAYQTRFYFSLFFLWLYIRTTATFLQPLMESGYMNIKDWGSKRGSSRKRKVPELLKFKDLNNCF